MGVTYKLTDEVVHFIINQRQGNPLFSCRQLAESASQKFGVHLSKSSVHDVLKESGIITPRGRKPKDKFKIPQEKKKQIQESLSQVKLLPTPVEPENRNTEISIVPPEPTIILPGPVIETVEVPADAVIMLPDIVSNDTVTPFENSDVVSSDPVILSEGLHSGDSQVVPDDLQKPLDSLVPLNDEDPGKKNDNEVSAEYEGAGRIFLKAALWDLGIFSEENISEIDWKYYLTYTKGIKVLLENNKEFFIDMVLPIERCIRETVDGLVNNVKPLLIHKVSNEDLFKACMDAQMGFKINSIEIVGNKDHEILVLDNVMECKRLFTLKERLFVENYKNNLPERAKTTFFSQNINNIDILDNIMVLKGFDTTNKSENVVTIIIDDGYENKEVLLKAAEILNGMFLRDEQDKLVSVKVVF